jgi:uncharacterized protein involved in response to NO
MISLSRDKTEKTLDSTALLLWLLQLCEKIMRKERKKEKASLFFVMILFKIVTGRIKDILEQHFLQDKQKRERGEKEYEPTKLF